MHEFILIEIAEFFQKYKKLIAEEVATIKTRNVISVQFFMTKTKMWQEMGIPILSVLSG